MLDYSHDGILVLASLAIALMAGFTGLSLTQGASTLPVPRRKLVVSMAAVALGGGIWSMHFVAMLGLRLPFAFYYDGLTTLISALIAILIVGLALLILHFGERTTNRILAAGGVIGLGIPAMHYVGMSGMEICRPVYAPGGIVLALAASLLLSTGAVWVAYGRRDARGILLGTVGFGLAVFAVHFIAMAGTGFVKAETEGSLGGFISNQSLAYAVTLAAFVLSGAFLLTGVTFAQNEQIPPVQDATSEAPPRSTELPGPDLFPPTAGLLRVPYEKDGQTKFVEARHVAAVRAEGHYTLLYVDAERLFCPWSITETAERLPEGLFVRSHRSYLINTDLVTGFERTKDTGVVYFEGIKALAKAPVSRSRLPDVRAALGL